AQYPASEAKFKEVLELDKNNATAIKYLADIAAKLAEQQQLASAKQQFDHLVAQGDAATSAEKWQEAITAYSGALAIEKNPGVEQKLAFAQQKSGELAQAQEADAKYTAAITAANA